MHLALEGISETKRIDEVASALGRIRPGEVLTVLGADDPRTFADSVLARVGDGFDRAVLHAPHKKEPLLLLHFKRKHRG